MLPNSIYLAIADFSHDFPSVYKTLEKSYLMRINGKGG